MRARAFNERVGNLPDLDCGICRNKGNVAEATDRGLVLRECECMARRRSLRRIKQSGLADALDACTMDKYKTVKDWQKDAKAAAQRYIERGRGKWFVMSGCPGSGKTHLCTAICGELLKKNIEVRYMLWRSEAPRLKALIGDREEYERIMRQYSECDVLYIDDFFKGTITEADINLAFELLNNRYISRGAGTIISSEQNIQQLIDIDEAIGSRIAERAAGYLIETPKDNIRLKRATKKGA